MKTILVFAYAGLGLLSTCVVRAQSSFGLRNGDRGVNAPVYDAQGVPLAGSNYLAELWGGASSDSLAPAVLFDQGNRREIVAFASRGYFISSAGFLSVLTVPPNGLAWLEVRAWDTRLGATYEEVAARGLGGYGESPLFQAQGGNPFDLNSVPPPLTGLQSFSLRSVVPEPNPALLLLLGLPVLIWRCRRKGVP